MEVTREMGVILVEIEIIKAVGTILVEITRGEIVIGGVGMVAISSSQLVQATPG